MTNNLAISYKDISCSFLSPFFSSSLGSFNIWLEGKLPKESFSISLNNSKKIDDGLLAGTRRFLSEFHISIINFAAVDLGSFWVCK